MLTFCCTPDNDLYTVLARNGSRVARYDDPADAIEHAPPGFAVLLLSDGSPEPVVRVDGPLLENARAKGLRLYAEFPASAPGILPGPARATEWERAVVASGAFGTTLPSGRILSVAGCRYLPASAKSPWLVIARVAGFDTAIFGIPESATPVLYEAEEALLVATTALSRFVTQRFSPAADWVAVWAGILGWLAPGHGPFPLSWTPAARPAYGPDDVLPDDWESKSLAGAAGWVYRSALLPTREHHDDVAARLRSGAETMPPPTSDEQVGDGAFGVLEGYASAIHADGSQSRRLPIRADCQAETAMVLSMDWAVHQTGRSRKVAGNLLKYLYATSGLHGGARGNPAHPAYGLISWGLHAPAWEVANYGDDNARALLATMLASACLETDAWDEAMLRAFLANLRTTGRLGFRGNRIDMPDLERRGWRAYADAETLNLAPHYEAYMWACYLWAYRHTEHKPFLECARSGITRMMKEYPKGWRLRDNSERGQMLLPLAWLLRLENAPEVRDWIHRVAGDLVAFQQPCGAVPERMDTGGADAYTIVTSNESYGTGETPLIQKNGDPTSDQLYTTGFALLGLHEAATATKDAALRRAEDRLAAYLCRIQIRSERFPYLHGAWFRAFDFNRWDYWSSSADAGWGAWCVESGWGQAWIATVMGLRRLESSLWDRTARSGIRAHMDGVQAKMAVNMGGPWKPPAP